jgi:hypothetical protein
MLMALKINYPSFPLHPVALPVSTGGAIEGTVAAVFIAWAAKAAVLRWGGQRVYRYSLQVALGLIVGDAGMTSLLSIVRQAFGLP